MNISSFWQKRQFEIRHIEQLNIIFPYSLDTVIHQIDSLISTKYAVLRFLTFAFDDAAYSPLRVCRLESRLDGANNTLYRRRPGRVIGCDKDVPRPDAPQILSEGLRNEVRPICGH